MRNLTSPSADVAETIHSLVPVYSTIRIHIVALCRAIVTTQNGQEVDIDSFQRDVFTVLPHFSRNTHQGFTHQGFTLQRLAIQELSRMTDPLLLSAVRGLLSSIATVKEVRHTAEYLFQAAERVKVGQRNLAAGIAIFGGQGL